MTLKTLVVYGSFNNRTYNFKIWSEAEKIQSKIQKSQRVYYHISGKKNTDFLEKVLLRTIENRKALMTWKWGSNYKICIKVTQWGKLSIEMELKLCHNVNSRIRLRHKTLSEIDFFQFKRRMCLLDQN